MKKFIPLILTPLAIGLIGYFFRYSIFASRGVLEINTTPPTIVVINGEEAGTTPFKEEFSPQRLDIKFLSFKDTGKDLLWQGKVPITAATLTMVKYTFEKEKQENYGEILTFNKIPDRKTGALLISSYPDGAIVNLDGEIKGHTPILLEKIPPGHHTLELNLTGYNNTVLGINIATGFQLNAEIKLSAEKKLADDDQIAANSSIDNQNIIVTILSTPTSWLRVRNGPGTGFAEVDRVIPGEEYPFEEQQADWLKIILDDNTKGWISAQYGEISDQ